MEQQLSLSTEFLSPTRANLEELHNAQAAVAVKNYLKYLLDAIPNAFLILNKHRQIVFANELFIEMIGANSMDDILGYRVGEILNCEHANETPGGCGTTKFCRTCGAARAQAKALSGKVAVEECRISTIDREALDLSVSARPLEINEEKFIVFTARDIANEKRRQALERTFFHDILNTAGIVSMYAQIIEMDPDEIHNVDFNLSQITDRLINEIRRQQDLVRAERNELLTNPQTFYVHEFLHDLMVQYRTHPVANGRSIEMLDSLPNTEMRSDSVLLGRILSNMIKNALEAIEIEQRVVLSYMINDENQTIRFAIHNPSYIPLAIQNQIFQRSFSTKGEGRGLGTYSMRLLSEKYLNGFVEFESTETEGTVFYATYPLVLD
jgi:signal transduction histidine kinase